MALKDYSDDEAVRCRGYDLVFTKTKSVGWVTSPPNQY